MPRIITPRVVQSVIGEMPILTFPGPKHGSNLHTDLLKSSDPLFGVTKTLREVIIPSLKLTAVGGTGQLSVMCNSLVPDQWTGYSAPPEAYTAYLTPRFEDSAKYSNAWEKCPSFPKLLGRVARSFTIRAAYINEAGKPVEEDMEGFKARVFQHEFDHCFGVTLIHPISAAGRLKLADGVMISKFDELVKSKDKKMKSAIKDFMDGAKQEEKSFKLLSTFNPEKRFQTAVRAMCTKGIVREFHEDFEDVLGEKEDEADQDLKL